MKGPKYGQFGPTRKNSFWLRPEALEEEFVGIMSGDSSPMRNPDVD